MNILAPLLIASVGQRRETSRRPIRLGETKSALVNARYINDVVNAIKRSTDVMANESFSEPGTWRTMLLPRETKKHGCFARNSMTK
jgi:hypothetical protein